MSRPKTLAHNLDFGAVIDGLGQGVLIFDSDDNLILDNVAARHILGTNLILVRAEGWPAAAMLLDAANPDRASANEIRAKALRQIDPVRFHTFLAGAYTPCWATAIYGQSGTIYTMITIDRPDWSALTELMSRFRQEAHESIESTYGHADLIQQVLQHATPDTSISRLRHQVTGFAKIMAIHMNRLAILMNLLQRLEIVRTGQLPDDIRTMSRPIELNGFIEDLLEELDALLMLEDRPEDEDLRSRIKVRIPDDLWITSSKPHLTCIVRDILRNSILYSPFDSPIIMEAYPAERPNQVQIDIIDQGYGIRPSESGRVFSAFQRARQPHILAETGYGLSLYLVKTELEAMHGRIWFTSTENTGTTFSFKLRSAEPPA